MKKVIFIGMSILFAAAISMYGCGSSEEANLETPTPTAPAVEETAPGETSPAEEEAPAMMGEMAEQTEATAESVAEDVGAMADQAMDEAMQMGQEVIEDANDKMSGEIGKEMDAAEEKLGDLME